MALALSDANDKLNRCLWEDSARINRLLAAAYGIQDQRAVRAAGVERIGSAIDHGDWAGIDGPKRVNPQFTCTSAENLECHGNICAAEPQRRVSSLSENLLLARVPRNAADHGLSSEHQRCDGGRILQRSPGDFRRIDDTGIHQVFIPLGSSIKAEVSAR